MKPGKRIRSLYNSFDSAALYDIGKAISIVKSCASAKFDETVEVAIKLTVDPRRSDQMVRGVCALPNGTGKNSRVAVFAVGDKAEEAKTTGADVVGAEDLVESISKGELHFDRCIATPDMMPLVGRVAKILGPRGLMPNPKVGTVTLDIERAVRDSKSGGSVEFRIDKASIVHAGVGKISFADQDIVANVQAFIKAVSDSKPQGIKGTFIRGISVSSSMGVGVALDLARLSLT